MTEQPENRITVEQAKVIIDSLQPDEGYTPTDDDEYDPNEYEYEDE